MPHTHHANNVALTTRSNSDVEGRGREKGGDQR